jgi:hypothetical protein
MTKWAKDETLSVNISFWAWEGEITEENIPAA